MIARAQLALHFLLLLFRVHALSKTGFHIPLCLLRIPVHRKLQQIVSGRFHRTGLPLRSGIPVRKLLRPDIGVAHLAHRMKSARHLLQKINAVLRFARCRPIGKILPQIIPGALQKLFRRHVPRIGKCV